MGALGVQRKLS